MSTAEIIAKLTNLQELKRMAEELSAEIEAAQDEIKAIMGTAEELSAFFLTWLSAMADEYHKHERTRTLRKALHHWERTFRKAQNALNFELADDAKAAYWNTWREYIKAEGSVNA